MYECPVSKEYDGESLLDFVRYMDCKMGFNWDPKVHFVSLDDKSVELNNMQGTLVREGQVIKVFLLPAGG